MRVETAAVLYTGIMWFLAGVNILAIILTDGVNGWVDVGSGFAAGFVLGMWLCERWRP